MVVTEAGSYLRLIDSGITRLKAQGPSRACNESKEEEEKDLPMKSAHLAQSTWCPHAITWFEVGLRVDGEGSGLMAQGLGVWV